jgi:2'-5' RNA ligase
VRLFVAVNLPDPIRHAIESAAAPIRRAAPSVRWLPPDNFHITLKFLGSVPDDRVNTIKAALTAAATQASPFEMNVRGAGAFPNFRRARVYWVGVDGGDLLARLQHEVERTIAPLGFPTEARPFHPHITIGRVNQSPADEMRAVETASRDFQNESRIVVKSVELMESKLSPKGARYEAIQSVPLGGRP